ncbi:MAG TPA: hypothetical protein VE265_04470, partial [Actinomycetota bacterium]|nr:hypothetical protein [Actinomycetota bacterium]
MPAPAGRGLGRRLHGQLPHRPAGQRGRPHRRGVPAGQRER